MVPKFALHNKIINKTRKLKNQENSAHHFEDKYLANHLMKLPKDGIRHERVGVLSVSTGYEFLRKIHH